MKWQIDQKLTVGTLFVLLMFVVGVFINYGELRSDYHNEKQINKAHRQNKEIHITTEFRENIATKEDIEKLARSIAELQKSNESNVKKEDLAELRRRVDSIMNLLISQRNK